MTEFVRQWAWLAPLISAPTIATIQLNRRRRT